MGQGPSEARALSLLVVLSVLPLVLGLGNEVWYGDPSQYAEVARRIAVSGDWLHLFDNNGPNLNKPPLAMWGIALFVKLLGPTSEAIRLPALLFGVVMLIAVARIGTLLWSRSAGLCAAALLASSLAFQVMVGDPKVDMALTAMSACAVWMAFEARRRPWTIWLAWLFGGLGVLAKGPIGLVAPVAAVLPEAIRHQWGDAGPGTLRSRLWRLQPLGLLVAAAVVYPYVRATFEQFGAHGPSEFLFSQSFGRVLNQSEWHNDTTPLFFLHTGLWAFAPFVPALILELWRRGVALAKSRRLPWDESRVIWWWLGIPFVAISASSYKLPQYLFWLAPPAALIAARALSDGAPRALGWIWTGLGAVAAGALGVLLQVGFPPRAFAVTVAWIGAALAVTAGARALSRRLPGLARPAVLAVGSMLTVELFYWTYLYPTMMEFQPGAEWGELLRREDPAAPFVVYSGCEQSTAVSYYANRPAIELTPEQLAASVRRGEVKLAITEAQNLHALEEQGLVAERLGELPYYPTSVPRGAFLNARTRPETLTMQLLVRLRVAGP
ncbi:MAG TPA: glycosyltransferase family 39 protein [Myxococcaceae bacterium]|nr:glycosyltransferase family 39 protein [Myxococcaceae bacterium]